jgi:hypothetical protein
MHMMASYWSATFPDDQTFLFAKQASAFLLVTNGLKWQWKCLWWEKLCYNFHHNWKCCYWTEKCLGQNVWVHFSLAIRDWLVTWLLWTSSV